jgi:hypothetical protein
MADDVCSTTQSPIEAHGIIGDMRSAALVADNGSIDFCCWPEFDSPSIFTALLDSDRAGVFELAPDLPGARRQQIYLPDSNVLQTRWIDHDAVVEITDLMPIPAVEDALPRLIRRVQVRNGSAVIRLRCKVRPTPMARMSASARQASPPCACRQPRRCASKRTVQWPRSSSRKANAPSSFWGQNTTPWCGPVKARPAWKKPCAIGANG